MKARTPSILLLGMLLAAGWMLTLGRGLAATGSPHTLVLVASLPERARHLAIQERRLYLVGPGPHPGDEDRLVVVSIADPLAPQVLGVFETRGDLKSVVVAGRYAYLANAYQGMVILDVANPAEMAVVGRTQEVQYAVDIAVAGSLAYVAEGGGALRVFDISDPARPRQLGVSDVEEYEGRAVAVAGDYAYVASVGRGIRVVDVSDPAHPFTAGYYDPPGPHQSLDVAVAGAYAYVAEKSIFDLTGSLRVLDITQPQAPFEIASARVADPAQGVIWQDGLVYLAHAGSGLTLFDVSDPTTPAPLAAYNTSGEAMDVTLGAGSVFVADAAGGLLVLHHLKPATFLPRMLGRK